VLFADTQSGWESKKKIITSRSRRVIFFTVFQTSVLNFPFFHLANMGQFSPSRRTNDASGPLNGNTLLWLVLHEGNLKNSETYRFPASWDSYVGPPEPFYWFEMDARSDSQTFRSRHWGNPSVVPSTVWVAPLSSTNGARDAETAVFRNFSGSQSTIWALIKITCSRSWFLDHT